MKIGIIGSAGGSAFFSARDVLNQAGYTCEFSVVTDRECGLYDDALAANISTSMLDYADAQSFSSAAASYFHDQSVDIVLLMYSRIISEELYANIPVVNIHPSLLPDYPGMGAVSAAYKADSKILGATLHVVEEEVDAGQVIAQVSVESGPDKSESEWQTMSYLQKTYLIVLLSELLREQSLVIDPSTQTFSIDEAGVRKAGEALHLLDKGLIRAFASLQSESGIIGVPV